MPISIQPQTFKVQQEGAARLSRKKVAARHYGKEGSGRLHAAECFLVPTIPTRGIKFCFSPASYPLCFSSIFFWFLYVVTDWMALSEAEQVTNKYRAIVVITISGQQ